MKRKKRNKKKNKLNTSNKKKKTIHQLAVDSFIKKKKT